ncbi:MAG: hypothetical protein R3A79_28385 [Nannocystaceae bacterium]
MHYNVIRFDRGTSTLASEELPKLRNTAETAQGADSSQENGYPTIWPVVCAPVGTKLAAARAAAYAAKLRELGCPEVFFEGCPLDVEAAEEVAYAEAKVADDTCVMVGQWCPSASR